MARKILLVEHHDEPRDDLASTFLPKLGFTVEYFRPFTGQRLPDVEEDTAGIVITGGAAKVAQLHRMTKGRRNSGFTQSRRWISKHRLYRKTFLQCNFTAEDLRSRQVQNCWRLGISSQIRLSVMETTYLAHSFTRNVHSQYCGGGRRWTPLPGKSPEFRREKNKTGWPPTTSKMSSTGSSSCSEIFLHREQIMRTEYSLSRWSSYHVGT